MEEEIKRAMHEFSVENWSGFCNKAKEQGISEDFIDSEKFDLIIGEILLEVK